MAKQKDKGKPRRSLSREEIEVLLRKGLSLYVKWDDTRNERRVHGSNGRLVALTNFVRDKRPDVTWEKLNLTEEINTIHKAMEFHKLKKTNKPNRKKSKEKREYYRCYRA
jgi:hypothetical protein